MILKKHYVLPLVLVLTGGLAFACSSSDDPTGDGDGDSMSDGGASAGDGDGERGNILCVEAETTTDAVCVNSTDCGPIESGVMRSTAKDCLVNNCLGNDDEPGCVATCMEEQIETTNACSTCYGASASCSAEFCLGDCITDGDSPECVKCQADNGCTGQFFECSGLALPN